MIETTAGDVTVELFRQDARVTVVNFLTYVQDGFYTGTLFHRVIRGFMIQGGGYDADLQPKTAGLRGGILNEATNGLRNRRGTVAMARTGNPNSAQAQFFINTVDNRSLDHRDRSARGYGYAVFGEVVDGMDVVDRIERTRTPQSERPGRRAPRPDRHHPDSTSRLRRAAAPALRAAGAAARPVVHVLADASDGTRQRAGPACSTWSTSSRASCAAAATDAGRASTTRWSATSASAAWNGSSSWCGSKRRSACASATPPWSTPRRPATSPPRSPPRTRGRPPPCHGARRRGPPPRPNPRAADTVVEALEWHARRTPDRIHIHLREEDGVETPLTYGWLWQAALAVAHGLAARGLGRRETVAVMLRTERDFFPAFVGTLMAGCVPVPLYPPVRADRIEEYAERQVGILRNAAARLLITFTAVERLAGLLVARVPSLTAVVTADSLQAHAASAPPAPRRPRRPGDEPALIQYTSGSTGNPQGRAALACEPARQHPRAAGGARDPFGRRRRELAAALSRHGPDRRLARPALRRRTARPDAAARVSRPAGPAGCARSTTIGARYRRRPTSPTTCAAGAFRTTISRDST